MTVRSLDAAAINAVRNLEFSGAQELKKEDMAAGVDNGVTTVRWAHRDNRGKFHAAYNADWAPFSDPSPARDNPFSNVTTEQDFVAALKAEVTDAKYYRPMRPADVNTPNGDETKTQYHVNRIANQRRERVVGQARAAAVSLNVSDDAWKEINFAERDIRCYEVTVGESKQREMQGYSSYSHYAVHALEGRRDAAQESFEATGLVEYKRAAAQLGEYFGRLMRDKVVTSNNNFYATNCEIGTGTFLVHKDENHTISLSKKSAGGEYQAVPRYDLLTLQENGESKKIYWDQGRDKYFYDKDGSQVPEENLGAKQEGAHPANIKVRELPPKIGTKRQRRTEDMKPMDPGDYRIIARFPKSGEKLRRDFPFDHQRAGYVMRTKDTGYGWSGECDKKAKGEAQGGMVPKDFGGLSYYSAATGKTVRFSAKDLNEARINLMCQGDSMRRFTTVDRAQFFADDEFGGHRWDERPGKLDFGTRYSVPAIPRRGSLVFQSVTTPDGKKHTPSVYFQRLLVSADKQSFKDNPSYRGVNDNDKDHTICELKDCMVKVSVKLQVFDEQGRPDEKTETIELDFRNPPEEPVLLGSFTAPAEGTLWEQTVDLKNSLLVLQQYKMTKQADGSVKKEAIVNQRIEEDFNLSEVEGSRESKKDNPDEYLPIFAEFQSGKNGVAETSLKFDIWNGACDEVIETLVGRYHKDGEDFEVRDYKLDARFGNGTARVIHKLDAKGRIIEGQSATVDAGWDFLWTDKLAFVASDGRRFNEVAELNGLLDIMNGEVFAEGLMDLSVLNYAADKAHWTDDKRPYIIERFGNIEMFKTQAEFETARTAIENTIDAGQGVVSPPPVQNASWSGQLEKDAYTANTTFTAQSAGEYTLTLNSTAGDMDVYANVGEAVSMNASGTGIERSALSSANYGDAEDAITVRLEAGETLNFRVHGWTAGTFEAEVKAQA